MSKANSQAMASLKIEDRRSKRAVHCEDKVGLLLIGQVTLPYPGMRPYRCRK
jgi:hypothetical protein